MGKSTFEGGEPSAPGEQTLVRRRNAGTFWQDAIPWSLVVEVTAAGINLDRLAVREEKMTAMCYRSMLLLLITSGMVAACTPTIVRDCYDADWYSIGVRDGLAGVPGDILEVYRSTCGEVDMAPDPEAYENGRREGLRIFCTDANGFRTGRARKVYHHVCPPELEKEFLAGRARGLRLQGCAAEIYVFEQYLTSLEEALKQREQRLATLPFPAMERVRLQQEIDNLKPLYQQAVEELDVVESRCLEAM